MTESWISGDAWIYRACITHICCCFWTGIRFICFLLCHHINIDMAFWTFQYFNRFHIVDVCNSSGLFARSMVLIPVKYCVIHYDTVQICCSHIITKSNWDNGKNSISIELYCLGVRQSFKWKYLSLYPPCRCNLMRFKAAYNTIEIQKKTANNEKKLAVVCWCWSIWNGSCAQAEHFFILRHSFWWCENFWFLFSWNFLFRRRSCHLFISFSKNCGNCHLVTIVATLWKCVRLFCKCLKHFHLIYWVAARLVLSESRQLIKVHEQNELNYDFFRDFIIKMQFS